MLVRSLSPALGHRVLFAHALLSWSGWVDPGILLLLLTGPRSSSLMTSWVPGSLAYCCLFPAVVPGCCNRQGPITKSPSEGETTGEKRTRLALSFHLHEKAQYNLKYDINHSLTLIPPYYRKKSKIFAQETYCLPIAQQTNQSFRIKEREKKEIICLCLF